MIDIFLSFLLAGLIVLALQLRSTKLPKNESNYFISSVSTLVAEGVDRSRELSSEPVKEFGGPEVLNNLNKIAVQAVEEIEKEVNHIAEVEDNTIVDVVEEQVEQHNEIVEKQESHQPSNDRSAPAKQDSKVYNKRNSTSTLYIRGTVSNPDIVELLKCISISIQREIKLNNGDKDEDMKMRIFDERYFPIQEKLDIDIAQIPQEYDIFLFIGTAFDTENLAAESAILMRAYIDRLCSAAGLQLFPWNWRRVVLSTLILASKVWEEEEVWNSDFKSILPCLTARDLNVLERNVLNLLQYNVTLKSGEYAKYYFEVRALTKGEGLLPETPLDNQTAELIEAKSRKKEEAMSSAVGNSSLAAKRREIASYSPGKFQSNTPAVLS